MSLGFAEHQRRATAAKKGLTLKAEKPERKKRRASGGRLKCSGFGCESSTGAEGLERVLGSVDA